MEPSFKRGLMLAGLGALGAVAAVRYSRTFDFRGKTVLITGGSRGLGLLLARRLADEGARVAICARDSEELHRAAQEIAERSGEALALEADIADREQVEQLVQTVRDQWGPVEVLINNAGIIQVGPMEEMTLADYEQAMQTHFWGPLHATLAVLPEMRRRGFGRIVNISSIGGKVSVPHLLPYSASKFALVGFSEGLRAELLQDGVYVTTVCPGLMRTGSAVNAEFKGRREAEFTWFAVSGSAPLASVSGERAARQIVNACRRGAAEVVLSLPAKAVVLAQGVAPGLVADTLGLVNRLLPAPGGAGKAAAKGRVSRPRWLPGWLTALSDRAALRNNELGSPAPSRVGS
jgi:short-subunit dehydrogenase